MSVQTPAEFWEDRYSGVERVWSGRVNATLEASVADLEPGRALDLGCGEGGDAIWLAERGWRVTGVDLSPTAIGRAERAAADRGVAGRARFVAADLATYTDEPVYDLVAASFLQSPVELPRERILRAARDFVAPGGRLLIVAHAAAPAWAPAEHVRDVVFPTPAGDLTALGLDAGQWRTLIAEVRQRAATGPHGEDGMLLDGVVLVERRR